MSWFFALIDTPDTPQGGHPALPPPLHTVSRHGLSITLGGQPETCLWHDDTQSSSGWAVVGTGLSVAEGNARFMTHADWNRLMTNDGFDCAHIDGHFVALRWQNNKVEFYTDQLGLRTAYFARCTTGYCVSTRLDWVSIASGNHDPDLPSLGGRWLIFNQLSYESCVSGIHRIGPSGHMSIASGEVLDLQSTPWRPPLGGGAVAKAFSVLESLVRCAQEHDRSPSLGLSGGLDSRLLLSLFACGPRRRFSVHTFGDAEDPDVKAAERISGLLDVTCQYLNEPLPSRDETLTQVKAFAAQTLLAEPASSFLKLRFYPILNARRHLMVDGGFGEIGRRQYLNRVATLGRHALRSGNIPQLLELMSTPRADIFSNEARRLLREGTFAQLQMAMEQMPPVSEIGVENYVDLLAVRTRIPNYGGPEQARIDSEVMNFMPLVQPTLLKSFFMCEVHDRANGRTYREAIRSACPVLSKVPLVKSGTPYPFGMSTRGAWLLTNMKSRIGKTFHDPSRDRFLRYLRDPIMDRVHSSRVRNNSLYDAKKVMSLAERYFAGEARLGSQLDWWVTFDLWQSSLSEG